MHIEDYIRDRAEVHGFDRVVVVGKVGFIDIQVMVLPKPLRCQGKGTAFMNDICAEADRQTEILALYPEPLTSKWTQEDKAELARWYERFGFEQRGDDEVYRGRHVRIPEGHRALGSIE